MYFILCADPVYTQEKKTTLENPLNEKTISVNYFDTAKDQSPIYIGKLHTPYPRNVIGNPYLLNDKPSKGDLCYDGILYPDISMRLDIYKNELLLLSSDTLYNIVLDNERVEYAYLHDNKYEYLSLEEYKKVPSGYYRSLYNSSFCQVLKNESASLKKKERDREVLLEFIHNKNYYLLIDGIYYPVKNKGTLLNVLQSHKKELNRYIKLYKIDFKHSFDEALVSVVKEYEKLIQQP